MNNTPLFRYIGLAVLFGAVFGIGSYALILPDSIEDDTATHIAVDDRDKSFGWKYPVAKFPSTGPTPERLAYSSIRDPGGIPEGLPVRLRIPVIGVDTAIEDALITPDGRMDVPAGSENVAWFALGPPPGKVGSSVIGGHYGIYNDNRGPSVFYNLEKIKVGDKVYIVDDNGETKYFVVRSIKLFERSADATTVFTSEDGIAHLNLITCEGVWNKVNGTYPLRRVVFTDLLSEEASVPTPTPDFPRPLSLGAVGNDVAALQDFLRSKGLLTMPPNVATGYFGPLTSAALATYQESVELPPVGTFGPLTKMKVISDLESSAKTVSAALPMTAITPSEPTTTFPQTLSRSVKSLYETRMDALITSILLISVLFLAIVAVRNGIVRQKAEKDLEAARKEAKNILKDLRSEKMRLAELNAKDEALLESIGEGVVAVDQHGNVIVMNKAAEDLLGFTSGEKLGEPFTETLLLYDESGKKIPDTEGPMVLALSTGETTAIATYHFMREGRIQIPVAMVATPVLIDGTPTGAIVVFHDITKEKEIEKLRTDFLSLASHQLRTPLSGTKWLIETIQRGVVGELNPRQEAYLQNLYQINERMIGLVADMLNVLLLESGATVLKKEDILVSQLCQELFLMMEPVAKAKGVTLTKASGDLSTLKIESDLQILRNTIENFVGNAINYSPKNGEVVLNAEEKDDAVVFSVKDSGIGIPKGEQERIFDRFYRASNAKKHRPDGTGLGLYVASLLAKKIGGHISFESAENKGTTFYLRVPKVIGLAGNISSNHPDV